MSSGSLFDRSQPPPASPVRPYRFPTFHRSEPAAGVQLLAMRAARQPLVSLELRIPGGMRYEADRGGLATFAASLLDEGTPSRSSPEIAALVEGLGGALSVGADRDSTYIDLTLLARHRRTGLELLRELLVESTFPTEEIERRRGQRLAVLLRRRDQPATMADERLAAALFVGGPYGRPLFGTEESVGGFDRPAITDYHRQVHRSGPLHVIATGELDPAALEEEVGRIFAGRDGDRSRRPEPIRQRTLDGVEVHLVNRPHAAQTELRIGHVGIESSHPDAVAARVMNSILGGKFSSRINLNLRERNGLTYGASSYFIDSLAAGPFVVSTAVESEKAGAAVREVLSELQRIRSEPVSLEELEDARNYLVGSFAYTVQTVEGLAARLSRIALHQLRDDYYRSMPAAIAAVDRETVLRVACDLLRPANLAVVAVGPAALLAPQLEDLGELGAGTHADLESIS